MKNNGDFYNKEFHEILQYCNEENLFLGEGTPSADILIIGKEVGFNRAKRNELNKADNKLEWLENKTKLIADRNVKQLKGLDGDYQTIGIPRLKNKIAYNPTWSSYQKLVSLIRGVHEDDISRGGENDWDFLDYSFITDISQFSIPYSNYLKDNNLSTDARKDSIAKRSKMFHHPFFRRFPIVIVAVGPDYIKNGKYKFDFDIEREFNVKYNGQPEIVVGDDNKNRWFNIHKDINGQHRIVIHTRQLSTVGEPLKALHPLIKSIAETCKPYYNK